MTARQKALRDKIGEPAKREIMWFGDVHDCDRHNTYSMIDGDKRSRWDEWVQAKLDAGREWEQITKRELSQLGYEALLAGEVVEIKNKHGQVIARGRTDLSLRRINADHRAKLIPVEMKQMQTFMWEAIAEQKDLLRNPWTRKYLRQIFLYMYGKNIDEGLFFLGDFQGHWKLIPVYLDYEFVEDVIRKIERAAQARQDARLPDRIPYDPQLCGSCQFAHICIPDISMIPSQKIEGSYVLGELFERRDQLLEKWAEVEKINAKIKKFFEDVKDGVFTVGNFVVTRKNVPTTRYEVPDDIKLKYAVKKDQYKNNIERFAQPAPEKIFMEPKRAFSFIDSE